MDFKAKTRAELQGVDVPQPGEALPCADEESLRDLGATKNWPRTCEYAHPTHTISDLMRPGYFQGELRKRMHTGDTIHYCLYHGSKLPSEWIRGIATVQANPNTREQPLILASVFEYPQPKIWDGEVPKGKAA